MNIEAARQLDTYRAARARMGAPVVSTPVVRPPPPRIVTTDLVLAEDGEYLDNPLYHGLPETSYTAARKIMATVAQRHGVTLQDILSSLRREPIRSARWEAIRAVRAAFPHWSLPRMGRAFNRHHTMIMDALNGGRWRTRDHG